MPQSWLGIGAKAFLHLPFEYTYTQGSHETDCNTDIEIDSVKTFAPRHKNAYKFLSTLFISKNCSKAINFDLSNILDRNLKLYISYKSKAMFLVDPIVVSYFCEMYAWGLKK